MEPNFVLQFIYVKLGEALIVERERERENSLYFDMCNSISRTKKAPMFVAPMVE